MLFKSYKCCQGIILVTASFDPCLLCFIPEWDENQTQNWNDYPKCQRKTMIHFHLGTSENVMWSACRNWHEKNAGRKFIITQRRDMTGFYAVFPGPNLWMAGELLFLSLGRLTRQRFPNCSMSQGNSWNADRIFRNQKSSLTSLSQGGIWSWKRTFPSLISLIILLIDVYAIGYLLLIAWSLILVKW